MLNPFISRIPAGVLLAAAIGGAAIEGTVRDGQGKPVAGVLVVAENTDLADVTDADGHFELSTVSVVSRPQWQARLKSSAIEADALGRMHLALRPGERRPGLAAFQVRGADAAAPSIGRGTLAARSSVAPPTPSVSDPAHLLMAGEGHFAQAVPFDPASSAPLSFMLEKVDDFAKTNEVNPVSGDFKVLSVNDSVMRVVDTGSRENGVCKAGQPVFLPDTSDTFYKIMGKTLYQWDKSMADSGDYTATVFTSKTGALFGVWNMLGMGQAPMALPADAPITQGGIDSLLEMQHNMLKVAGTMTFGPTRASIDVQYGVCMGSMMGAMFQMPPITATAKSCTEVELKNGEAKAVWSFVFKNDSTATSFTYNGKTCTDTFASNAEPTFDCTGKADGEAPEETTEDPAASGMTSLVNCPGFIAFFTGGVTLPEIPILPLGKQGVSAASSAGSWSGSSLSQAKARSVLLRVAQLRRSALQGLPKGLR